DAAGGGGAGEAAALFVVGVGDRPLGVGERAGVGVAGHADAEAGAVGRHGHGRGDVGEGAVFVEGDLGGGVLDEGVGARQDGAADERADRSGDRVVADGAAGEDGALAGGGGEGAGLLVVQVAAGRLVDAVMPGDEASGN